MPQEPFDPLDTAAAERNIQLSLRQQQQLKELMSNYKLTPMTLAMKLNPRLMASPFHSYVSAKVAHTIAKGNGRLVISAPPRHGKSEIITKNTPIWTLENYGMKNVILCTYGGELSTDFGRKIRDLVQENQNFLDMKIRQDAHRVNNWHTDKGGAMMSVGVGGPITGRGADVLLIDDYLKDIKEAMSPTIRDGIWDWFQSTAFTRIEPGGSCIIIATRWHEDDLIGRILKHNPGGNWESIIIPAVAEVPGYNKDDPKTYHFVDILGRKNGEPLFPERYPLGPGPGTLMERKDVLGSYFFNALFQQRPESDTAKLTDKTWLKYFDQWSDLPWLADPTTKFSRDWDLAATEDGGDWLVGTLSAYHKETDQFAILNIKRKQLSPGKVEELVRETALEDGIGVTIGIEQEPGSSGKLLIHSYATRVLQGFTVVGNPTNANKVLRAQPWLANVENGKTYVFRASWNKVFEDEYDEFPGGEHDDQIDTAGAGYMRMSGKTRLKVAWGRGANGEGTPQSPIIHGPNPNDWRNQDKYQPKTGVLEGEIIPPTPTRSRVAWGQNRSSSRSRY